MGFLLREQTYLKLKLSLVRLVLRREKPDGGSRYAHEAGSVSTCVCVFVLVKTTEVPTDAPKASDSRNRVWGGRGRGKEVVPFTIHTCPFQICAQRHLVIYCVASSSRR